MTVTTAVPAPQENRAPHLASSVNTPYLHHWVAANKLSKGEHLKTPGGATVTVVGGTTPKQHDGWMWDLTVPGNNDHDFYVAVAASAVLVHNCGPDLDNLSPKIVRQMEQRGWTSDQIQDAYDNGEQVNAVNRRLAVQPPGTLIQCPASLWSSKMPQAK